MASSKHTFLPSVLMAVSLCLLAIFEIFWLRGEYKSARKLLQEEQTMRFHSAIRELEDSLFHVSVWFPMDSLQQPELRFPQMQMSRRGEMIDTAKVFTVIANLNSNGRDSMRFKMRRSHRGAMMLGALSGHLQNPTDDSLQIRVALTEMISSKLHAMVQDESDLEFRMVTWDDETPDTSGIVSKAYFDLASGRHYAITYPDFKKYLLKNMLPQIAFAIALFACIAGAFYVISRSLARQHRLAEMRSNLISNITHELKTPIATVHVALEALQNFKADKDQSRREEYLNIAQSEVNRLAVLVDKVLRTSGQGNGRTELKMEDVDMQALISQVMETLKMQFTKMSAHVSLSASGENFRVKGDKLHLTGLVHNLIDNALKYGGLNPQIMLSLNRQNDNITFSVTDHGSGIPKVYQERIFDKFFRVPSGDTHNIKGHGLGLSYVAEIVREHGGKIEVKSEEGKGSTFTVTLPAHHGN